MAVIKANAYGHGAVETATALARKGITRVAVVSVDEGIALRMAGITASILVLGPLFAEQIHDLVDHRLTPVVSEPALLLRLAETAAALNQSYPVHLKVETGMGRLGLTQTELVTLIASRAFPASLRLEGLMTHLADADGAMTDVTEQQLVRFNQAIDTVKACGLRIPLVHAANSGGAVRFPQAQFSLVRPGIMLYGYHTLPSSVAAPDLKPVLQLRTTVAQIRTIQPGDTVSYNGTFTARRPTRIAILPIGYADGFSRRLSNRGQVLVHGRRAGIVGLVCMDMVMIDVTDVPGVIVGDEVVLIGRQGQEEITATEMANWTGTIPYEVLCSIGPRVPRLYSSS
jgi:alanine racemase